jgi:hypothetical protein
MVFASGLRSLHAGLSVFFGLWLPLRSSQQPKNPPACVFGGPACWRWSLARFLDASHFHRFGKRLLADSLNTNFFLPVTASHPHRAAR